MYRNILITLISSTVNQFYAWNILMVPYWISDTCYYQSVAYVLYMYLDLPMDHISNKNKKTINIH